MRFRVWRIGDFALAAMVACLILSQWATADGIVFAPHAAPAEIPEQSALIAFDGTTETLVIETRFVAKGKDFAWVVPLPAKPEVRAGTPGLFPTLRAMFLPKIWIFREFALVFGLLVILCGSAVVGMFGGQSLMLRLAVYGSVGWFLLNGCLLTSLGVSRGVAGDQGVTVLERSVIGDFDVAVVQSADAAEMQGWVSSNGFASTPQANAAIADYVRRGWVFVASKLRRSFDDDRLSAPTPLIFRFPTRAPVYPMQLTGSDAKTPLRLELFVFGKTYAFVPGCEIVRRGAVSIQDDAKISFASGTADVQVSHRTLRELLQGTTHATLLRRTMSPAEMKEDLPIYYSDAGPTGNVVTAPAAAGQAILAIAMAGFLFGAAGSMRRAAQIGPWPAGARGIRVSMTIGLIAGLCGWMLVPTAPVAGGSVVQTWRREVTLQDGYYGVWNKKDATTSMGVAEFAQAALEVVHERVPDARIEDSPGNFFVWPGPDGPEYAVYTWNGQEVVVRY